jgi:hypothetical protein
VLGFDVYCTILYEWTTKSPEVIGAWKLWLEEHEPEENWGKTEDKEAQEEKTKEGVMSLCLLCRGVHNLFVTKGEDIGKDAVDETHPHKQPEQDRT